MEQLKFQDLDSVLKNNEVVFIDFFATWCMPCKMMMPVVESLAEEFKGEVAFYKVDVDLEGKLAQKFEVKSIPTFFVIKNGKVEHRIVGATKKEALAKLLR